MKFYIFSLLVAILAACAYGATPQKQVLVTAESSGIIDHFAQWIEDKEGVVLHKFHLINAILAKAPATLFDEAKDTFTANNWGNIVIEEDQEVHTMDDGN
ncbi:hypothetical protein SLS57_010205 [Botryosphaeria dothidea]